MTRYFDTQFARNDNVRRENHGLSWSDYEYEDLKRLYTAGMSLHEMCMHLKRPGNGVIQKLVHLGLIQFNSNAMKYECVAPYGPKAAKQPQPKTKEPIMNAKTPVVQTKTFIAGTNANDMSDAAIFELIAETESSIEKLSAIKTKPKKLIATIEKMQKDIDDLVALVDARP